MSKKVINNYITNYYGSSSFDVEDDNIIVLTSEELDLIHGLLCHVRLGSKANPAVLSALLKFDENYSEENAKLVTGIKSDEYGTFMIETGQYGKS